MPFLCCEQPAVVPISYPTMLSFYVLSLMRRLRSAAAIILQRLAEGASKNAMLQRSKSMAEFAEA
jgi:hypothetical protein